MFSVVVAALALPTAAKEGEVSSLTSRLHALSRKVDEAKVKATHAKKAHVKASTTSRDIVWIAGDVDTSCTDSCVAADFDGCYAMDLESENSDVDTLDEMSEVLYALTGSKCSANWGFTKYADNANVPAFEFVSATVGEMVGCAPSSSSRSSSSYDCAATPPPGAQRLCTCSAKPESK